VTSANINNAMLSYIQDSPTPFHAVKGLQDKLHAKGFERLCEGATWNLQANGRYYVTRNDSAIIAFKVGNQNSLKNGVAIAGAHTDSPCLKVKPNPEIIEKNYLQLAVEVYGGALLSPWFDRDLSLAGRVDYRTNHGELSSALINFEKPIAFIPSLAIHLDRTANEGRKINPQTEMAPIVLQLINGEKRTLDDLIHHQLIAQKHLDVQKVLSHELLFYDVQPPSVIGFDQQFIAGARLDNLISCYVICKALCDSKDGETSLIVCNDHEEVGSASIVGAQGPFLRSVLERLTGSSSPEEFSRFMHKSLMLSVDNAHGVHPNFVNKHDKNHGPILNKGPVVKLNANQRYATSGFSHAVFSSLCERVGVPYQSFVMRSDMGCGSTIGPITSAEVGVKTVDVGVATFGMHSVRELAGSSDIYLMAKVITEFFSSREWL